MKVFLYQHYTVNSWIKELECIRSLRVMETPDMLSDLFLSERSQEVALFDLFNEHIIFENSNGCLRELQIVSGVLLANLNFHVLLCNVNVI